MLREDINLNNVYQGSDGARTYQECPNWPRFAAQTLGWAVHKIPQPGFFLTVFALTKSLIVGGRHVRFGTTPIFKAEGDAGCPFSDISAVLCLDRIASY
uniref:Monooxygenase n=1 Tax=Ascaris lumbricoides TaxID=6252 RepID=A0A0M3IQV3_ASCLU